MQIDFGPSPSFKPPKTTSDIFINALYEFTRFMDEPDEWFDCAMGMQTWDIVGLVIEEMSKQGWNIRLQGAIKNLRGNYPWYVHFEKWDETGMSQGYFEEHEDGPCAIILAAIKTLARTTIRAAETGPPPDHQANPSELKTIQEI